METKFQDKNFLIVGGDSLVGKFLSSRLASLKIQHTNTTRRQSKLGSSSVFLDLSNLGDFKLDAHYSRAIICIPGGGFNNFSENQNELLFLNSSDLIRFLTQSGVPITYLSTSAVFSGRNLLAQEDYLPDPITNYGKFKARIENFISSEESSLLSNSFQIIRFTKILSLKSQPLESWVNTLADGQPVTAFEDLTLSPISLNYAVEGVLKILMSGDSGYFHLSGEEDTSYYKFLRTFCGSLGFDVELVFPTSYHDSTLQIKYTPAFASLGMNRTQSLITALSPQPDQDMYLDLLNENF